MAKANTGLISSYNAASRQIEIKKSIELSFNKIRSNWVNRNCGQKRGNCSRMGSDSVMIAISNISDQVASLKLEIENFEGPHMTQVYRTLNERCSQLQLKLDKIGIEGRDDAKKGRKTVLMDVDLAAKRLASRIHPGGICPECQVKQ